MTVVNPRHVAVRLPDSRLSGGTLAAACAAVCAANAALAIPAVLNGWFQDDLGTTSSQLTWVSDAFLIPVTVLELTFSLFGDLFGRKRLLVGGALLIVAGALIGVLTPGTGTSAATRVAVLWIAQLVSGTGAAAIYPTSLAMVAAGTHAARDRARAITIWAALLAAGGAISPVLGGWLVRFAFGGDPYASWRWPYLAVMFLALSAAAICLALAKDSSAPAGRSLDWPGQITIALGLFSLLYATIQGPTSGWTSSQVISGIGLGLVCLALFVLAERRSSSPLLRLDLFANRSYAVTAAATVLGMFVYLGTAYATSIRLSAIQGFSPLRASLAFVLLDLPALAMMPLTWRVMERYNPRWMLGAGFGLLAIADLWLAAVPVSDLSVAPVVAPLILAGAGFALSLAGVTAVAVNTVPTYLAGMASGSASMLRDLGFTLGPAVIGAIALSQAAGTISARVAADPALAKALAAFSAGPAHAPAGLRPALRAAVGAVGSGPLGANAVPASIVRGGHAVPFNPLKEVAFQALGSAYSLGYLVCAGAALAAAALAVALLGGRARDSMLSAGPAD